MKTFAVLLLSSLTVFSQQVSYFNQGFLRQQNAAQDLAWLGLSPSGSGSVTNFNAGNFSPLFTSSVATATTFPHLTFSGVSQSGNLVYASPDGGAGIPTFRALTLTDLPTLPTGGSVTNFGIGDLSPLFTTSVATPTTFPTVTLSLSTHANNTFLAGPNGGGPLAPTFRTIATGDLPDITSIVRGDVSATAPVLYDSATGIFSMHVADVSHDGYLSSVDWGTFNGKGSGTLTGVTNASLGLLGVTILSTSNPPAPSFKSISAGANITITDTGTNLSFAASSGGGGGASGSDLLMTNLTAYANGTNFYIDFSVPAATILSTGDIAFNYSTNWGLSSTSRVCNIYIPPTNIFRQILFLTQATNWHDNAQTIVAVPCGYGAKIQMQLFGVGETNVAYTPSIDAVPTGTNWIAAGFNPTNSQGGCVAWWEASQQLFQDEFGKTPIIDGVSVRAWTDLANVSGKATNGAINVFNYWHNPNTAPGNIPSINLVPIGGAYLVTSNFTGLPQVNWAFMMLYGRGSSLICFDGLSEGFRFACQFSETPAVPMAVYSGSSVTATPGAGQIQWRLFAFSQNTTTSVIRTNGVQAATGNSGTQAPSRFTIGSDYNLSTEVGNYNIAEIIVYHTNLTLVQVTNVENYFRTKYKTW